MKFGSLRVRLTAWYFGTVGLLLALFALGALLAMRASIVEAVDHDLRVRISDVRDFLDQHTKSGRDGLRAELREQSLLGLGGGLVEVSDGAGAPLYRSPRLGGRSLDVKTSQPEAGLIVYANISSHPGLRVAAKPVTIDGNVYTIRVAEPMHEFVESMERFEALLLVFAPALLILASFGGFWMSGRALSPVDRITRDARLISIRNLSRRLQVPRANDELHRLAVTLNDMLDRIDDAVKRIVQFTADASHELRAPLTLIQTAAEFSLRRERTREELVDAMRKISWESKRTSRLVDDLLLLARAGSGADGLRLAPTDLAPIARNAAEQVLTLAEPKRIEVRAEIPIQPVIVEGDEQALARVLLILLDNAVKYTNEGGRITFQVTVTDSRVEALVSDTGAGIAAADLPHIYDRFWRADKVRSRSMGGTGLGLSIARSIVERHSGEIEVQSEPGRGSQFTIRLPLLSSGWVAPNEVAAESGTA
jgi:heavy metal sensor kinase